MKNYSAKNVAAYIASAPKEARTKLKEVRAAVQSVVPQAEEKISWGVPFYWYHGALVGFAAGKKYVLFGLAFALSDADRAMLEKRGYTTGKKTVRIGFDQKVPLTAVRQLLGARAKRNKAARRTAFL